MTLAEADSTLQACADELTRLERLLKRSTSTRVTSSEEKDLSKAISLTWFRKHRDIVQPYLTQSQVENLNAEYKKLFEMAEGNANRLKYRATFRVIRVALRESKVVLLSSPEKAEPTPDLPPSFAPLITDVEMQRILVRRWEECVRCLKGGADLAAIVMMGGLLEALLLARVLREPDKNVVFRTTAAPRDKKTAKTLPLQVWTLNTYIEVARELDWISRTARDIGGVLRDYRNYVHPQKELSDRIVIKPGDSSLMWEVAKSIARQLLRP